MLKSAMRCLLLSSLLMLAACATYPGRHQSVAGSDCVRQFIPAFTADWYHASIDVTGHHISGLLLFKTMPDSSMRVVFTTEAGATLFDFEWTTQGAFNVKLAIRQLNRKAVITLLRKDFEMILMRHYKTSREQLIVANERWHAFPGKRETNYIITDSLCQSLLRIEKASRRKKKAEMTMQRDASQAPDYVHLQHFNFNMKIDLKKLHR